VQLQSVSLSELTILDEASFTHVAAYSALKRALARSSHRFHIPAPGKKLSWDRATFLNLTFWSTSDDADVLCEDCLPADVVAHVAWHCVAAKALRRLVPERPAAELPTVLDLFFGEAIASAFDLYLVGRLLRNAPHSDFIETQVAIMAEAAEQANLDEADFAALLDSTVTDPEAAFEDLRALLFDVTRALWACTNASEAQRVLESYADHRFEPLLHHFQLSNWVLYARAYGTRSAEQESAVLALDATLRAAPVALDWLLENWVNEDSDQ
jgi:hypothetical protein